jgi:CheY-like chemotaxis protein|tara:strand:- start:2137 stop:2688 length:552 start_codon:yes stop_codon:yes gene_type:complete
VARWCRFFESLHAKVLFAAFIPGVIVLIVVAIIAQFAYERTVRMLMEQRDAELTCMSAAQLNNGLDQRSSVLETIANDAFVQALDLDGVRLVLDRMEYQTQDFDGGVAANGREAVEKAQGQSSDVILMDLRMPEMTGVEAMRAVSERDLEAKIIVLTTYDTDEYIFDAIEARAKGYLLKDTSH